MANAVEQPSETTMRNLCRVCSSPGSHDIHGKIPRYVHEVPTDHEYWTAPISKLIAEATGMKILHDDGLPQRICVVCISYMKHSYTFQRQLVQNTASMIMIRDAIRGTRNSVDTGSPAESDDGNSNEEPIQQGLTEAETICLKQDDAPEEKGLVAEVTTTR